MRNRSKDKTSGNPLGYNGLMSGPRRAAQMLPSFLLTLSFFLMGSNAYPQAFVQAQSQSFYLDLDVESGVFSQWRHDDLGSNHAIEAAIRIPRIRKHDQWVATLTLRLQDSPQTPRNHIGLQMSVPERKGPFKVQVVGKIDDRTIKPVQTQTTVGVDETVAIRLSWSRPNTLLIRIKGESLEVPINWVPRSLVVAGSTGEFIVDPIRIGTINQP